MNTLTYLMRLRMSKRKKEEVIWLGPGKDTWNKILKPRLENPRDGDRWVVWETPDKVSHLVDERRMEIEELVLNGVHVGDRRSIRTGVLKCVLLNCKCFGKTWRTSLNNTHTDLRSVKKICDVHSKKDRPRIDDLLGAADTHIDEIRQAQIRLCSKKGLPFGLFQSDEFHDFINVSLKRSARRHEISKAVCCSARTLLRWADDKSEENVAVLKAILPQLAEEGKVDVLIDHKFTGADRQSRSKVLGVDIS